MVSLLKNIVSPKNIIILLVLASIGFGLVSYVRYNGSNLGWCLANANDCRVARIQALDRNFQDAQPKVADEGK